MAKRTGTVKQQIASLVESSVQNLFPNLPDVKPLVAVSTRDADYQCNNAMGIWNKIKGSGTDFQNANSVGQALVKNLPQSEIIETTSVSEPGFVNIILSTNWISKRINDMLIEGIEMWAPILDVKKVVVDFSSPNIAKEMHVGHLRSTIIGDTIARMLEYSGVEVLRRNHVGDWGTQFGILIEYLFEEFPDCEDVGNLPIGDLEEFYKASNIRFKEDSDFKKRAQQAVVKLQGGEDKYRTAWKKICEISRNEYDLVYQRLKVNLEEKGESFYNPYIQDVLNELTQKGLVEESEDARIFSFTEEELNKFKISSSKEKKNSKKKKKIPPLIIVKSDGGFNYATTDLTALKYRLNVEQAQWIIYVTGFSQQLHFQMFFGAAKKAGWLPKEENKYPKTTHVAFGLVLDSDGKKFSTRSSENVVRLVDLLDEAKNRSKTELIHRWKHHGSIDEWTEEEIDKTAEAVGYGAVKYADLKNNRLTDYTFSFEKMLSDKGNTAVYLEYAHARICSIIRKSNKGIEELQKFGKITLGHPDERVLGLHLIQFAEAVEEACTNLLPNVLCEYLYNLSETFTRFYTNCKVNGSPEEMSRLLLCQATAVVMRQCFFLLGITPVFKL